MASSSTGVFRADPSKEFFIFMLTRDVSIARSILDLVDNSVDAAHRMVREDRAKYSDFRIDINVSGDCFEIVDNCGGISRRDAEEYAFHFGRPPGRGNTAESIGQFGVGMKRTIFKLGEHFIIESVNPTDGFRIEQNVRDWTAQDEWAFPFAELDRLSKPAIQTGTLVRVDRLFETVATAFRDTEFLTQLLKSVNKSHALFLNQGLRIYVRGVPAAAPPMKILASSMVTPGVETMSFGTGPSLVKVTIVAGVTNVNGRDIHDGGWYIFCNGRLIEAANQGSETGWGVKDSRKLANYRADFAFFRGYVFFESENSALLPWTTTKTGVDVDSPIYVAVRKRMMEMMRPIISFLNERTEEEHDAKYEGTESHVLNEAIGPEVSMVSVLSLRDGRRSVFSAPKYVASEKGLYQRIAYLRPKDEALLAKEALHVETWQAVGEKTFEYYFKKEVE